MIEPCKPNVSVMRQCQLLNISHSCFCYKHKPAKAQDLELMRLIDYMTERYSHFSKDNLKNAVKKFEDRLQAKAQEKIIGLRPYKR